MGIQSRLKAIIFDLDGVLIDSEPLWEEARRRFAASFAQKWTTEQNNGIIGMDSRRAYAYLSQELDVELPQNVLQERLLGELLALYGENLPVFPGSIDLVRNCAEFVPVGLASSSSRRILDFAVGCLDLQEAFGCVVSGDEVKAGKPAPDIYVEACGRLNTTPSQAVAIEDSDSGISAACSAGLVVIVVTGSGYATSVDRAGVIAHVDNVGELTYELIAEAYASGRR